MHDPSTDPAPFVRPPVAGPQTLAPEPGAVADDPVDPNAPRTLEALIADLERKLEDLTVENQELKDARDIYETERTRLMEAFDTQRAQLVANDEKIANLEAALATATGGAIAPADPGSVV